MVANSAFAKRLSLRNGAARGEHQPLRGSVKHEPHLIGDRAADENCAFCSLMRFPICPRPQ
jgi:hypothetical protein